MYFRSETIVASFLRFMVLLFKELLIFANLFARLSACEPVVGAAINGFS